jgi:hypothetical protein
MTTTTALLEALALCRQELPSDTHPIYLVRIQIIERLSSMQLNRSHSSGLSHWRVVSESLTKYRPNVTEDSQQGRQRRT